MHSPNPTVRAPAPAASARPCQVLCVDDQSAINEMLQCLLEQAGHVVECAADGQEALERITADAAHFDLLITDHQMPRLNGLQLVTRLRQSAFRGRIVVHSSALSAKEVSAYRLLAVDHILSKPADVATLLRCVDGPMAN